MPEEATRRAADASAIRLVAWIAIAAAVIGVFSTWTSDGPVTLNGIEGPNNGWLIVILSAFALGWTRPMARGSWVGVVGVLGASIVMGWTALENWLDSRDFVGASASYGLLVVVAASVVLGSAAIARGAELTRRRTSEA